LSAGEIDLYPKLLHSFGKDFVISQTAAVRATAYSFYNEDESDRVSRGLHLNMTLFGHTRLYKKYGSLSACHRALGAISFHNKFRNDLLSWMPLAFQENLAV